MNTEHPMRKYRRLTLAEQQAIRLQYEAGMRQVDLAEAFGVTQSTISKALKRMKEAA